MNRTIRAIGPVTETLRKAGFRQYAAIFEDGKQVPNVALLSIKVNDDIKLRFVGHFIDSNGEVHKTAPMLDMKRTARRIMSIREGVLAEQPEPLAPAPKTPARRAKTAPQSDPAAVRRAQRAARRQPQGDKIAGTEALIDCTGCGTMHRHDIPCPW